MEFRHEQDPKAQGWYRWPYVYLHGIAEKRNAERGSIEGWDTAADIFVANGPMPTEVGEYRANLYGREVVAVLAVRDAFFNGRVAEIDDPEGLAHAREPDSWR